MKPYSLDLRQRVLDAWQRGEGSQRQLAARFSVHLTFVRNLLRLYRQSGSLKARPHGGGRRPLAEGPVVERLAQMVAQRPDDTLDEHRERLAAQGGPAMSRATLARALQRLKLTVKKKEPPRQRARPKAGASRTTRLPGATGPSAPGGPGLRGRERR
jgi:transposase